LGALEKEERVFRRKAGSGDDWTRKKIEEKVITEGRKASTFYFGGLVYTRKKGKDAESPNKTEKGGER